MSLENKAWKTLSSKTLINDPPWLTVREQEVQLPSGHILERYYTLDYPDWVCIIAINSAGEILIEKQYRHSFGQIGFELPAGVVDEGEDLMEAAKRELLEETGYGDGQWKHFMSYSANPATSSNLCHCFIAEDIKKIQEPKLEDSEDIETLLLSRDEIIMCMKDGKMPQSMHQAPLWRYFFEN